MNYTLILGIFLVFVQLICHQIQNEMFRYQETNTTFSVPVEGIYMNHTWLVFLWFGAWVICCYKRTKTWYTSPINPLQKFIKNALEHWSIRELIFKIIVLEWIMFVPNVAWTMSVERVSVTLSIATQQSTCVFVYLFTLCCFKEINKGKRPTSKIIPALAVISCLFGVLLVYFGEENTGDVGDGKISNYLLLSVNPVLIAVFDLIFTKWSNIICQDVEDIMCLMGFMGIACCITCWPALLIDDSEFQLPWPRTMNGFLLYGNSVFATCFNFSFMFGLSLMGALFISVGSVLQLPLSAITDLFFYNQPLDPNTVFGCLFIIGGFVVLTFIIENNETTTEQKQEPVKEEEMTILLKEEIIDDI